MKNKVSKNEKAPRRISPLVWIGYLLVVTMVVTGVTFSGYVTRSSGGDTARVAKFQVTEEISVTEATAFVGMYPGSEDTWPFEIENESEVALRCSITLSSTKNLPLVFSAVADGEEIPLLENTETEFISLDPLANAEGLFLKAVWQKGDEEWDTAAAEKYMYEADAVTVTITTEQIN